MNKKSNSFLKKEKVIDVYRNFNQNNKNLFFLIKKRFNWMNNYISEKNIGIEIGSGAGFSKFFIKSKKNYLSDITSYFFLDYKKLDAQKMKFKKKFNYIIASNVIHHLPYPVSFFYSAHKALKRKGKIIIFEPNCSLLLKLIIKITKHESYDFSRKIWKKERMINSKNIWNGNNATPNLIFDNKKLFKKNLGHLYRIKYHNYCECLIFILSGGVYSKSPKIKLNFFFLKLLNLFDIVLSFLAPKLFSLGQKIVLEKI